MIYKNALEIQPISYIYPNKKERYTITSTGGGWDGANATSVMYNIGNQYANVRILEEGRF